MNRPHGPPIDFEALYAQMEFRDDVKGGPLDRDEVIKARRLEMDYFRRMCGRQGCLRMAQPLVPRCWRRGGSAASGFAVETGSFLALPGKHPQFPS